VGPISHPPGESPRAILRVPGNGRLRIVTLAVASPPPDGPKPPPLATPVSRVRGESERFGVLHREPVRLGALERGHELAQFFHRRAVAEDVLYPIVFLTGLPRVVPYRSERAVDGVQQFVLAPA
jgi:hypothetical protein